MMMGLGMDDNNNIRTILAANLLVCAFLNTNK